MPLTTCLAAIFILGEVEFSDRLVFRDILPERLMRLLVNKLDLISATSRSADFRTKQKLIKTTKN